VRRLRYRILALSLAAAGLALLGSARPGGAATLVQLRADAPQSARTTLAAAGATLVAPELRLWKLRGGASTLAELRADGAVSFEERDRTYTVLSAAADTDPLAPEEWWRADVRVDQLTGPGPGVPITLVDSGVSFGHQEFVGRPNLIALNSQEPAPIGGVHGTATASVAGAPVNGIGLVGIYPQSILRSYDASLGDGTQLPTDEIARGIVAAAQAGKSVINLSLGGPDADPAITAAIDLAVRDGGLVVAASGNSGDEGDDLTYPGASPHVLTIAATDESDHVASFSTESPWVDLSAPGVDIPVASALDDSYQAEDGTSFSSPMVAGAAAWLWTVRPQLDASQVAEILRQSARDVGTPGYDDATGYGILDMTAALAAPTPTRDSPEPNDTLAAASTLTTAARSSGRSTGRVAAFEDPIDVLRVWLPKRKTVTATVTSGTGVAIRLQGSSLAAGSRLALGKIVRGKQTVTYRNTRAGRSAYLVVTPKAGNRDAVYTVSVAAH
jgi:hypothetical protein